MPCSLDSRNVLSLRLLFYTKVPQTFACCGEKSFLGSSVNDNREMRKNALFCSHVLFNRVLKASSDVTLGILVPYIVFYALATVVKFIDVWDGI